MLMGRKGKKKMSTPKTSSSKKSSSKTPSSAGPSPRPATMSVIDYIKKQYMLRDMSESWEKLMKYQKQYKIPTKYIEDYYTRQNRGDDTFKGKPFGVFTATAPYVLAGKYFKELYGKKNVQDLRNTAKKYGIYTVWKDGKLKSKDDLVAALWSFVQDPKGFKEKQRQQIGPKEPEIAKAPKAADMDDQQKALNAYSKDELVKIAKKYKEKYETSHVGGKFEIIEDLIEKLPEHKLEKIMAAAPVNAGRARKQAVLGDKKLCLQKFKVPELKMICDKHGVSKSGLKADIINRLLKIDNLFD